jgi:hypothetical protein
MQLQSVCHGTLPWLISFSLDADAMSELLQRFRERFQIWREERERGAWGPPSGSKPRRNPLLWGVFAAIGALLPPWHFRDALDVFLPALTVVFLVFYFAKSRFAWHVLAADLLIMGPLYVFLSPSWRLQRFLHPSIIWVPIVITLVAFGLLIWSRKRYFQYLEQQRDSEIP